MLMIHDNTATTVMRTDMAGYQQASVIFRISSLNIMIYNMITSRGCEDAVIRR